MKLSVVSSVQSGWSELFSAFLNHIQASLKYSTYRSYKAQMRLFEEWIEDPENAVELEDFRPSTLDSYLVFRQTNGVGALTRSYDAKIVRLLLNYAFEQDFTSRRPLRYYKVKRIAPKKQRCPTVEELQKFLRAVEDRWNPKVNAPIRFVAVKERRFYRTRDLAIFTGLMETACRVDELLQIRLGDLDTAKMQFTIQETKGGCPRTVPFTTRWLGMVNEWRKIRPRADSDFLFISTYGDALKVNQMSSVFRTYRDLAGLSKDLHLHSLRHYALTVMAETDVLMAQEIAGHKDLKTTMIYVHAKEERNRKQHAEADPLGKILINKRTEAAAKTRRKLL